MMGKDCVAQKYSKNTSITIKDDKDGKKKTDVMQAHLM